MHLPMRGFLLAQGYAWAASSYSRNAYDPSQGAKDTHAPAQFFNGKFGKPRRTYVTGASMSGHVTAVVAEQWEQSYDGAMPIYGVLGDIANVTPTTGNLRIPMVTLHTLGDLFVPFHMEQEYARRVAAHGASDLLVQRATRDFGHCSFTGPELVQTFVDLVTWVEAGVKPEGDDVLDPAVVADPNYGCKFTDKVSPRLWDTVPGLAFLKPAACPAN